jgi:hypothetical protein
MPKLQLIVHANGGKGRTYAHEVGQNRDTELALTLVESGDLDGCYYGAEDITECPNCGSPVDDNGCTATNDRKCGLKLDDIIESTVHPHCAGEGCDAVIYTNDGAWVDGFNDYYCANCVEIIGTEPED